MTLNFDIIGKTTEQTTFTYTKDTMILYALGNRTLSNDYPKNPCM